MSAKHFTLVSHSVSHLLHVQVIVVCVVQVISRSHLVLPLVLTERI